MPDLVNRAQEILADELSDAEARLVTEEVYGSCVLGALQELSRLRPRMARGLVTLQAGPDQPFPPGWDNGLSTLISVEFPVGYARPRIVPHTSLMVGPGGWRLLDVPYNPGDPAVLTYTQVWTEQSLPDSLSEGVAHLVASLVAEAVAARFGRSDRPAVPVDSVNYRDKSDVWRELAADLRRRALVILGIRSDTDGNAVHSPASRDAVWGWPTW